MLDPGMPYRRRVANWIANVVTYLLFAAGRRTPSLAYGLSQAGRDANADHDHRHGGQLRDHRGNGEKPSEMGGGTSTGYLHRLFLSKGQSFTVGLQTLMKLILAKVQRSML